MKSKENACPKADKPTTINHLTYTLDDFKNASPIIDADAVQLARFSRGRPTIFTELIVA